MGFFTRKDWRDPYRRLSDGELLERIRTGDPLAEEYLWETYHPVVLAHMNIQLRDRPQQLGDPADYAQDTILLLLDKARLVGATAINDDNRPVGGWLKRAASYLLQNAVRKDRFDRDDWQDEDTDVQPRSATDQMEDKSDDVLAKMIQKERDRIIWNVLAALPETLRTLIRYKFMDGFSWKETAELMLRLYPDNDPPFALDYLQKTYWDRIHKKPFIKKLGDDLNGHGYDF